MKIGDIVTLPSGGPKMTIQSLRRGVGKQSAHCIWFDRDRMAQGFFDVAALKMAITEDSAKVA
jgi:uncharacterized protein YodC (DUF2158 family)